MCSLGVVLSFSDFGVHVVLVMPITRNAFESVLSLDQRILESVLCMISLY